MEPHVDALGCVLLPIVATAALVAISVGSLLSLRTRAAPVVAPAPAGAPAPASTLGPIDVRRVEALVRAVVYQTLRELHQLHVADAEVGSASSEPFAVVGFLVPGGLGRHFLTLRGQPDAGGVVSLAGTLRVDQLVRLSEIVFSDASRWVVRDVVLNGYSVFARPGEVLASALVDLLGQSRAADFRAFGDGDVEVRVVMRPTCTEDEDDLWAVALVRERDNAMHTRVLPLHGRAQEADTAVEATASTDDGAFQVEELVVRTSPRWNVDQVRAGDRRVFSSPLADRVDVFKMVDEATDHDWSFPVGDGEDVAVRAVRVREATGARGRAPARPTDAASSSVPGGSP